MGTQCHHFQRIDHCGREGRDARRALELFEATRQRQLTPSVIAYDEWIGESVKSAWPERGLELFDSMHEHRLTHSVITCNASDGLRGGADARALRGAVTVSRAFASASPSLSCSWRREVDSARGSPRVESLSPDARMRIRPQAPARVGRIPCVLGAGRRFGPGRRAPVEPQVSDAWR